MAWPNKTFTQLMIMELKPGTKCANAHFMSKTKCVETVGAMRILRMLSSFVVWGLVVALQVLPHRMRSGGLQLSSPHAVTILEGPGAVMAANVVDRLSVGVPEVERQLVVIMGALGNVLACYFGVMVFRFLIWMCKVPLGSEERALCKGMEYDRHKGIMMPFWSLIPFWVIVLWIASSQIRPHSSTFMRGVLLGVVPGCLFSVVVPALEGVVECSQWVWPVAGITMLLKGLCSGIAIIRMQEYMKLL